MDRLVGYQCSPIVSQLIRGAQSIGRVQTVALRMVAEREKEIEDFQKENYYTLTALVRKMHT